MANLRVQRRRKIRGEQAATLVEFALLAPLIFALILGMFTGGISLGVKNSMTNAVREAARFGATIKEDDAQWATKVESRAIALSGGDLRTGQVCVELLKKTGASTETPLKSNTCSLPPSAKPPSASIPVGDCAVKVWAYRTSDLNVIFFTQDLKLNASSVNLYERACP